MAVTEPIGSGEAPTPPPALVGAVRRLLRPLVRLLIGKGVGLPLLTSLLKEVYVAVAEQDFPVGGKKQTDSRISLLTGVHRKDVKRLRNQEETEPTVPKAVGLGPLLVAKWVGSKTTTDAEGQPLPLPRQAPTAGAPSFDS